MKKQAKPTPIDFTSKAARDGWEKKWDVIQRIWSYYQASSKLDTILIPIGSLTVKGRTVHVIGNIIEGLKKEDLFISWHRGTEHYEIKKINHEKLPLVHQETEVIWQKFAKVYRKRIVRPQFPPDFTWTDIAIQFLDGQEAIVKVKEKTSHTNYEEMGFQDKRKKCPNKQWEFLKDLSVIGGEISWNNSKATLKGKKRKQLLADTLKTYFQIDEDPFYPYRKEKAYKIKIALVPEQGSLETNSDSEIEKLRKDQSPEIYNRFS